jgi:hypothetical protein
METKLGNKIKYCERTILLQQAESNLPMLNGPNHFTYKTVKISFGKLKIVSNPIVLMNMFQGNNTSWLSKNARPLLSVAAIYLFIFIRTSTSLTC